MNAIIFVANQLFGASGNSGFIFYDPRIATGITVTGRYIIQYVANSVNIGINSVCGTRDVRYNIYSDTDSAFMSISPLIEKYYAGAPVEKIISAMDQIYNVKLEPFVIKATDEIAKRQNYYKKTIAFKREKLISGGFMVQAKKYALKVYDNEGVRYSEPDYAITGIEVVRSSTPEIVRKALKECIVHVIDRDIEKVRGIVQQVHQQFMTEPIERIAFPRGANNLLKYSDDPTIYKLKASCPIAVRGSLLYNHYINQKKLTSKYEEIQEGDKIKFIYVKMPNPIKEDVIAFIDKLPPELGLEKYIDRELQFEKAFMGPLNGIMNAVGWKLVEGNTLDDFFG